MAFLRLFVSILILLSFVSCTPAEDDYLSVAVAQEPPVLDLMINSSVSGRNIADGNVYERLIVLADGTAVPHLADSFGLSGDGCTLTLKIRNGVFFHDGSKLDAEDAALSMNRWLSSYPNADRAVNGARFIAEGESIVITASSSLALLPVMMASSPQAAVVVPSEYLEGKAVLQLPPGTGPYRIKEWRHGDSIMLESWDQYWGEKPAIKSIALHQGGENGSIVLVFNKNKGISADLSFRRAVSLFLDRDELMKACYGDYGYSLHSDYMDSSSSWRVYDADPYGYEDDEKGRAYLDSSSFNGETVRILTSNLTNLDKIAVSLSSQLEEEGIATEIIILDWAAFIDKRNDPDAWDIYVSATSSTALPLEKIYLTASSPGGFDDPESEALLSAISSATDIDEAIQIWQECQKKLWEYVPVIVPGHYSTVYASSSSLHDIDFSQGFNFRKAWIAEE